MDINMVQYNVEHMNIERLRSLIPTLIEEEINIATFQGTQNTQDRDVRMAHTGIIKNRLSILF